MGSHVFLQGIFPNQGSNPGLLYYRQALNHLSRQGISRTGLQFSLVQLLSCVPLFSTPWTAARQASLSITSSWSLLTLISIESVMPSNHLILCRPLLLPPAVNLSQHQSEVAQSCPTLCDPMDCSLSGSSVHGIFQARVREWIAISFSRGSS